MTKHVRITMRWESSEVEVDFVSSVDCLLEDSADAHEQIRSVARERGHTDNPVTVSSCAIGSGGSGTCSTCVHFLDLNVLAKHGGCRKIVATTQRDAVRDCWTSGDI